jgi:hypothetical protein
MVRPTLRHKIPQFSSLKKTPFLEKIRVNLDAKYRIGAANLFPFPLRKKLCVYSTQWCPRQYI